MTQVPALDWDKPLRTKSGHKARLVCRDVKNDERTFLVLVDHSEFETATAYDAEGRHATHRGLDLENAPERTERWMRLFDDHTYGGILCNTRKDALAAAKIIQNETLAALIRVEYEGDKPVSVALEAIE